MTQKSRITYTLVFDRESTLDVDEKVLREKLETFKHALDKEEMHYKFISGQAEAIVSKPISVKVKI